MAKFSHPVENSDADFCFGLLIVEVPGFEFRPNDRLPSAHLGLYPAALIVAGGFLPGHPAALGLDFGDMPVANRRIER
ncbi:hypothetical protein [Rhizobium leguminosarum]|jgi:hypothetical protein|uniref:hypothetical protein n=1 Tax=Rhizobium leguminosarum TaxID=384 RepID=UPI001FE0FF34|nr:hypothetical protein [Rhizobium leguminosarum]